MTVDPKITTHCIPYKGIIWSLRKDVELIHCHISPRDCCSSLQFLLLVWHQFQLTRSHRHEPHKDYPDTLACLPNTDGQPQNMLPVILCCAILGSPCRHLTIHEIYAAMEDKYAYYKTTSPTWKVTWSFQYLPWIASNHVIWFDSNLYTIISCLIISLNAKPDPSLIWALGHIEPSISRLSQVPNGCISVVVLQAKRALQMVSLLCRRGEGLTRVMTPYQNSLLWQPSLWLTINHCELAKYEHTGMMMMATMMKWCPLLILRDQKIMRAKKIWYLPITTCWWDWMLWYQHFPCLNTPFLSHHIHRLWKTRMLRKPCGSYGKWNGSIVAPVLWYHHIISAFVWPAWWHTGRDG